MDKRQKWALWAGIGIGLLALWLAARGTDPALVLASLGRANLWLAPVLLGTLAGFFWAKALRWKILLAPLGVTSVTRVVPPMMVGYAGNISLPAQLGEVLRMFLAARELRLPGSPVLASIVLERTFDFLTVPCLFGLALLLDARTPPELTAASYVVGGIGLALLGAVLVFGFWTDGATALTRRVTPFLPPSAREWVVRQLQAAATGLRAVRSPGALFAIIALSLLQWALMGVCTYVAILALGLAVPLSTGFVVLAFIVAGLTLPNSPGFVGTVQLCFTLGLAPYGIGAADALAASIYYHALVYVSVLLAGLYYLHRLGYRLERLTAAAKAADSTDA